MLEVLKPMLQIQELDMQMIQLMRVKRQHQKEMKVLLRNKEALRSQVTAKEQDIFDLKTQLRLMEGDLNEVIARFKKLETQQHSIKKVEEFNALNHEMAQAERERLSKEQRLAELKDRLENEESVLSDLKTKLSEMIDHDKALEAETVEAIKNINAEGRGIQKQRDAMVQEADPNTFSIYERLMNNKRDRVIVPIENRCCSGCHITLTAQDENLVRKGERLVYCEHCSRIHYWPEIEAAEEGEATPKRRRRSGAKTA